MTRTTLLCPCGKKSAKNSPWCKAHTVHISKIFEKGFMDAYHEPLTPGITFEEFVTKRKESKKETP